MSFFSKFLKGVNFSSVLCMPHHSLKHPYCPVTEDYPDRGIFQSLFVSLLLQHRSSQRCPKCRCFHFKQALALGQSLHSCLSLPPTNDPNTQKTTTLEDTGHHCSTQSRDSRSRDTESVPLAVAESPPGSAAGDTLPAFSRKRAAVVEG